MHMATINIETHGKKAMTVTGDTLQIKDLLKELGGTWNKGLNSWVFPGAKKEEVVATLEFHRTIKEVRCEEGPSNWVFPGSKTKERTIVHGDANVGKIKSEKRLATNLIAADSRPSKRQQTNVGMHCQQGKCKLVVEMMAQVCAMVNSCEDGSVCVDIRMFNEGQPTKKGILLTASEWQKLAAVLKDIQAASKDSTSEVEVKVAADVSVNIRNKGGTCVELRRISTNMGIQMSMSRWIVLQDAAHRISAEVG